MTHVLVITGFASTNWREDTPVPVYTGKDELEGDQAMRDSECIYFLKFRNRDGARACEKPAPLPVVEVAGETDQAPADQAPADQAPADQAPAKKAAAKKAAAKR